MSWCLMKFFQLVTKNAEKTVRRICILILGLKGLNNSRYDRLWGGVLTWTRLFWLNTKWEENYSFAWTTGWNGLQFTQSQFRARVSNFPPFFFSRGRARKRTKWKYNFRSVRSGASPIISNDFLKNDLTIYFSRGILRKFCPNGNHPGYDVM